MLTLVKLGGHIITNVMTKTLFIENYIKLIICMFSFLNPRIIFPSMASTGKLYNDNHRYIKQNLPQLLYYININGYNQENKTKSRKKVCVK